MCARYTPDRANAKNASSKGRKRPFQSKLAIPALGTAIAFVIALPHQMLHATSNPRAGIPDGNRAAGVYSIDGGYGLRESLYQELVAQLLGG